MSERPQVVLLNPDAAQAAVWERAVGSSAQVRVVADEAGLARVLADRAADVLVAPCDAVLLEAVQRWRTYARLVLCGETLPEGVLDAAGEGTDLRQVAGPEHLRRAVLALARPRSPMGRQRVPGLTVTLGEQREAEVLDLSNRGLSFRLELGEALECFLPGEQVHALRVRRGGELLLEAEAAQVRYVEQAHDNAGTTFYKIGCELLPGRSSVGRAPATKLDDTATCAGLLRSALRKDGVLLQLADDPLDGQLCERGSVDLATGTVRLELAGHGLEAHDVVRGTFELGASSYRFLSSVTSSVPLTLRLPSSIEATHRRVSARHRPDAERPIRAQLSSALFPGPLPEKAVLEISSTGLSLVIDPARELLPAGLLLRSIDLDLGGGLRLRCQGEVRSLAPMPDGTGTLRAGISFTGLSEEGRGELADALMRHRFPGLADGREFPFEDLWSFFEETRFIYPTKREALAPLFPAVRETFARLGQQTGQLAKSVVFHEEGRLGAHISAVRSHSRSFVLQHLAGSAKMQSKHGPRLVNLGISDYLAQARHLDYGKSYYRPENKWPARVFGGFARSVPDRHRSDLRTFDYLLYPTTPAPGPELPLPDDLRLLEARGADLSVVEQHYVATERGLILRSDDLTRGTLELRSVDEAFAAVGLFRRRHVLLALRRDEPVGFALCEVSSPGLNLSELLSSMRIVTLPAAERKPGGEAEVRAALLSAALPLYRRAGRQTVPLLSPSGAPEPLGVCAPLERKQYVCWSWHRSILPAFKEHVERMYRRLEETLSKRARRSLAREPLSRRPGEVA